ncbi:MAG: hypothetical protein JNM56_32235 [Planctomycetia bacterium]|nr:hypothetical protein [Planctomycetia bacterium]
MKRSFPFGLLIVSALSFAAPLAAGTKIVGPGETLQLAEDLVLTGDDVLEIQGTAEQPCTLVGNRHRLRTDGKWTGSVKIMHCTIRQLGGPAKRSEKGQATGPGATAIDLKAAGKGSIAFEHCTFDGCSAIHLQNDAASTASFRHNTVQENSEVAVSKDVDNSSHAFVARGNSRERKLFQGNFLARGKIVFQAPNWLIGGDRDEDSNLLIGWRIGVDAQGDNSIVRGNYFHLRMPINAEFPYWSQVSVFTTGKGVVGEHNIIRDGEWIVRFVEGEFRYNVITDIIDHDLMQTGSFGKVHHNLFLAGESDSRAGSMMGCIAVVYPPRNPGDGIEIYNNVFDGGGRLDVPAIEVSPKGFVKSVRSNVFFNFAHRDRYYKLPQAMIRPAWNDDAGEEKPARLGYADYNLFHNPTVKTPRNYLLSVAGKVERQDAGFGKHDVPVGGAKDAQAEPKFKGPLKKFPFSNEDIRARKVTVSQILAAYRAAYTPAEGSPLIDAGDPADGKGNFIGAVGAGQNPPHDQFGRFGQASGK